LSEAVGVDGVPRGWRRRRALGEAIEVDGMLQGWRRRRAPSEAVEVVGEVKVHLGPRVGFGGLMTNN
jgi:hypothetical protein